MNVIIPAHTDYLSKEEFKKLRDMRYDKNQVKAKGLPFLPATVLMRTKEELCKKNDILNPNDQPFESKEASFEGYFQRVKFYNLFSRTAIDIKGIAFERFWAKTFP